MPHAERLLHALPETAALVTVVDAHPATLSWLGSVRRNRVVPLGVDRFGQSGDLPDLYWTYSLDADAILGAVARAWTLSDRAGVRSRSRIRRAFGAGRSGWCSCLSEGCPRPSNLMFS